MVVEEKKRVMVTLTSTMVEKLEEVSKETGLSKSALIAVAISDWMAKREH